MSHNVELTIDKAIVIDYIDRALVDWYFAIPPRVDVAEDGDFFSIRIKQEILSQELDEIECRYPTDWKQAIKERFAPAWFKQWWPVRYMSVKLTARAVYPKIALSDRAYHILLGEKRVEL